ncbi:MAG: hypothetical protein NUV34_07530 [Sulfuricaulis sp.]|nr:hypothetical protein [Sulfuricaulis sp.]
MTKIVTHPATPEYRDGWDRIFGGKPKPGEWCEVDVTAEQLRDMTSGEILRHRIDADTPGSGVFEQDGT